MAEKLTVVLRRSLHAALSAGDLAGAAGILERLRVEDPLSVETRGFELELLVKGDRLDEAAALAAQLAALFPASARIHYLSGQLAYKRRDYVRARGHFDESQRLYPHWRTSRFIGQSLTQMGKLEEAEAILEPLAREHAECLLDISWLHERRGDFAQALRATERYLEGHPGSEFARVRRNRLRAMLLEPSEVIDEVEMLLGLGEEAPDDFLASYVDALLRTGQGKKARELLAGRREKLSAKLATSLAWTAYKLQAYDVAFEMFLAAHDWARNDPKYFTALEKAAEHSARTEELLRFYRARIPEDKRFYGRVERLERRRRERAEG